MAIISVSEETSSGGQPIGGSPQFTRTFTVLMTERASNAALVAACGVPLGAPHPENPFAVVVDVSVEQTRVESSPLDTPADENERNRREAQDNTPLPLPPDEILESELPGLLVEEE